MARHAYAGHGGSPAHSLILAQRPVLQSMAARHVVQGYLVVDRHIESDTDGVTTISSEALPGLTDVVDGFLQALEVAGRPALV